MLRSFEFLKDAAAHLVELDAFEQRLEVPFAEALVALALDDLEKDRADHVLREDLQEQALSLGRSAVHQDSALLQLPHALLMPFDPLGKHFIISVGRVLEGNAAGADDIDGLIDIRRAERD